MNYLRTVSSIILTQSFIMINCELDSNKIYMLYQFNYREKELFG